MTANNDWPGKPGVPLNPERDGWHLLKNKFTGDRRAALWLTDLHWGLRVPTHEMAEACIYLGPVLTPEEAAALQKRCEKAERERDALRRDASQEIATDEMVRRLQHLGDWQAADRIEALQKRVAELEGALKMAEQRFVTLKNAWDKMRKRNVPIYGSSALEGGKDE